MLPGLVTRTGSNRCALPGRSPSLCIKLVCIFFYPFCQVQNILCLNQVYIASKSWLRCSILTAKRFGPLSFYHPMGCQVPFPISFPFTLGARYCWCCQPLVYNISCGVGVVNGAKEKSLQKSLKHTTCSEKSYI